MRAWIYIIAAAIMQTAWGVVLKILDFKKAIALICSGQVSDAAFLAQVVPLILYLLLGLFIAVVISKAYKMLSMSIVYASWMGLSLSFQVIVDVFYYGEKMLIWQYLFIFFILLGILGMKLSNPKKLSEDIL